MIGRHAQRRHRAALGAALLLLFVLPAAARGHWLTPQEILAGLRQNPRLRESVGLVDARVDPALPRLLVIKLKRDTWEQIPADKRLALAQDWYDTWRHNVDGGIVALLDAANDKSLVHFDGAGRAQLAVER